MVHTVSNRTTKHQQKYFIEQRTFAYEINCKLLAKSVSKTVNDKRMTKVHLTKKKQSAKKVGIDCYLQASIVVLVYVAVSFEKKKKSNIIILK